MVKIRDLELFDIYYKDGLARCLSQLAECVLTKRATEKLYFQRQDMGMRTLVAVIDNNIVGTGSIIIEPKFLHNGSKVGHIEDVAVLPEYHGYGIGKQIMLSLIEIAKESGCYKILLDCDNDVIEFYKKLGFYEMPHNMRMDLSE